MEMSATANAERAEPSHEKQTYIDMMKIVSAIAQHAAHNPEQVTKSHPDRDDIAGFEVSHPVTPVVVYAKRGVTDDGWGYEWNKIHVHIAANSIGTHGIMDIKRDHGLEVSDVWQLDKDTEADMGQHDHPAVRFKLESRE